MARTGALAIALTALLPASSAVLAAPLASKSCQVLSQAEAGALYGAPLDPGRDMFPSCAYFGAGGDDHKGLIVAFIDQLGMATPATYGEWAHADPAARVEPVSGLGEQANFVTLVDSSGTTINLMVLDHGRILTIGAENSPKPTIKTDLMQAARQILHKF